MMLTSSALAPTSILTDIPTSTAHGRPLPPLPVRAATVTVRGPGRPAGTTGCVRAVRNPERYALVEKPDPSEPSPSASVAKVPTGSLGTVPIALPPLVVGGVAPWYRS